MPWASLLPPVEGASSETPDQPTAAFPEQLPSKEPSNLKALLQAYQDDVDADGFLKRDSFRMGYVLLLHSDAPRKKDFAATVRKFLGIAAKNGIVNINTAALKTAIASCVAKVNSLKHFKRDLKNIVKFCDETLKISVSTPTGPSPLHQTPVLNSVKRQNTSEPPTCRNKLKTDCPKCDHRRRQIASLLSKTKTLRSRVTKKKSTNPATTPSSSVQLKRVRQSLDRKTVIEAKLRAARSRWVYKCAEKEKEIAKLKEKLANTESGVDKAKIAKLRRSKSKLKSDHKRSMNVKQTEILALKMKIKELEKKVTELEVANDNMNAALVEAEAEPKKPCNIASKMDNKTYSIAYRKATYQCLSSQVPVETVSKVMNSVVKKLTNGELDCKADKSTISQFSYELGVLSDIQVAEVMASNDNLTLAWDATSLNTDHINEVHVYTPGDPPKGYVLQISALPGGTTDDYTEHLTHSIQDIVDSYSDYKKLDRMETLNIVQSHLKNTLSDRVAVNHCIVLKLQESMDRELLELKCNVHPLDGFASKA